MGCARPIVGHWTTPEGAEKIRIQRKGLNLRSTILTGGVDLLRWAIRQYITDQPTELYGLRRIGVSGLRWWFEHIRGIEFSANCGPGVDCVRQVIQLTSGIPLLLCRFDQLLSGNHADGDRNVDLAQFEQVCQAFEKDLLPLGAELFGAEAQATRSQLEPREAHLLRVIVAASSEIGDRRDWQTWLTDDDWYGNLAAQHGWSDLSPVGHEDLASVRLLQELGLVPVDDASPDILFRMVPVTPEDAVAKLVAISAVLGSSAVLK